MNLPLFSIIVVNFNGGDYLKRCLGAILSSDYDNYEIIIVDNGSTDSSIELIKENFAQNPGKIKILELFRNFGPAKARNEGVKVSCGQYLGFLDNDTEVAATWITEAFKCFQSSEKIAALQCKLLILSEKDKIDYAGEYLSNIGFLVPAVEHGVRDDGRYDHPNRILAAKSAGMFIRKDIFVKIGGFDEDYFIFLEETDLGWRCWLAGHEVVFCPRSVVRHHFSATKELVDKKFNNYLVRFHGTKNYIMTLCKNLSLPYLFRILPCHILLWFCLSFCLIITKKINSALNIWKAILWNLVNISKTTLKRREIQRGRTLSDRDIFIAGSLMKDKGLFYFINRFKKSGSEVITPENQ